MNKLAYLECPTGIAGDMCLGALVDAGVPIDYMIEKLNRLGIAHEYELRAESVQRNGQQAIKVHVELKEDNHHHHHHHEEHKHVHGRYLPEIERMITSAELPARVEAMSLAVFRCLADAEGAVHGIAPEKVHFHEVGATDAIVDIVGTCLGLDWLGIEQFYCSALPTGGGTVKAAHGIMPVPVPAVLKLWEIRGSVPVYSNGIEKELCTPTGVAIATTLATAFGSPPPMIIHRVAKGAGTLQLPIPNMVRLWIGDPTHRGRDTETRRKGDAERFGLGFQSPNKMKPLKRNGSPELLEALRPRVPASPRPRVFFNDQLPIPNLETISVLETQIDDLSPQAIAYTFDALFDAGALDVFCQPIVMKKSRSGILLTVICDPEKQAACESVLFRETTTLGIRRSTQQRTILQREIQYVQTPLGEVRVKVAYNQGSLTNVQPEYEDCAALAKQHKTSWREVHRLALQSWYGQQ